jgi:hypothetical protein
MQVGATVDEQIIQIANFSEPSPWESHRRPAQHGSHSYRRPKTAASGRNAARVEGPGQWSVAHCSDVSSEKLAENPSLNMPPPSRRIVLVTLWHARTSDHARPGCRSSGALPHDTGAIAMPTLNNPDDKISLEQRDDEYALIRVAADDTKTEMI